jgi:hypothetical protein
MRQVPLVEQCQANGGSHRPVSLIVGMQMIAAVVSGPDLYRHRRVANRSVKVDDAIELLGGSDPRVHTLAFFFAFGIEIRRACTAASNAEASERPKPRCLNIVAAMPTNLNSLCFAFDALPCGNPRGITRRLVLHSSHTATIVSMF